MLHASKAIELERYIIMRLCWISAYIIEDGALDRKHVTTQLSKWYDLEVLMEQTHSRQEASIKEYKCSEAL